MEVLQTALQFAPCACYSLQQDMTEESSNYAMYILSAWSFRLANSHALLKAHFPNTSDIISTHHADR